MAETSPETTTPITVATVMKVSWFHHLILSILALFSNMEHALKKMYDNLPLADQQALVNGSGILAVFNSMLDATVADIRTAITTNFPTLPVDQMEAQVIALAKSYGLNVTGGTFEEAATELKSYLASKPQGQIWVGVTTGLSLALALAFGGAASKAEVFQTLLGYVYKFIVRPLVEKTPVPKLGAVAPFNIGQGGEVLAA